MEKLINYSGGTIKFSIRDYGIYAMSSDSSIGKSHLYHILQHIPNTGVHTITYTKNVNHVIESINEFITSGINILYIDRFDLIISEDIVKMLKDMKDKYIILDYKNDDYNKILNARFISFIKRKGDFTLYA